MQIELVSTPQHESLVDLLCELHSYYNEGSSVPREVVRSHLINNLLGADSPLRLVVAVQDDDSVIGLAAISLTYSVVEPSPERGSQCQLKELYVRSSTRNLGIGKALMSWVARYATDRGCHRIDWSVKAGNTKGIAFYEGLGARLVAERLSYRLSAPELSQLAREK